MTVLETNPRATAGAPAFRIARPGDDEQLWRLLRENPMPAGISLSVEREPNYFSGAAMDGAEHQTIVAVENGRILCAGSINISYRFLNGVATRIGYLGGLRLDRSCRGQASILLQGYQAFCELHRACDGPPLYLTSIFSANTRAIRFLESRLPRMPTYHWIADFITIVFRVRPQPRRDDRDLRVFAATESDFPSISALLNRQNRQFQFAPVWDVETLQRCGELRATDFRVIRDREDQPLACVAIWDQRAVRQTVVRGYTPALRRLRPLVNLGARFLSTPRLPAIGQPIPLAFASHAAALSSDALVKGIRAIEAAASERRVEYLTIGFDARDPRLEVVRRHFRGREYSSRIYVVHWEDGANCAASIADGIVAPEVALL